MKFQRGVPNPYPRRPRGPGRGDSPYQMSRAAYHARISNLERWLRPRTYAETRRIELEIALASHGHESCRQMPVGSACAPMPTVGESFTATGPARFPRCRRTNWRSCSRARAAGLNRLSPGRYRNASRRVLPSPMGKFNLGQRPQWSPSDNPRKDGSRASCHSHDAARSIRP
jgi:hypothetical protein